MTEELMKYAGAYQALRKARCESHDATFLPLEVLRDLESDELHLSVSFSGTGAKDTYFSRAVSIYRAVQVTFKWLIVPTTISALLTKDEFEPRFGDLLEPVPIDGEPFWVIRGARAPDVKARIGALELSQRFRDRYLHAYLPDS